MKKRSSKSLKASKPAARHTPAGGPYNPMEHAYDYGFPGKGVNKEDYNTAIKRKNKDYYGKNEDIVTPILTDLDVMILGGSHEENKNLQVTQDILCEILCLPPRSDNIVDPPPLGTGNDLCGGLNSFTSNVVGKEYARRVLERGQFVTLTPITLRPNLTTMAKQSVGFGLVEAMDKVEDRLNITSYGYTARIAAKRYWRSVRAHIRAACIALGLDWDGENAGVIRAHAATHLPKYLYDYVYNSEQDKGITSILSTKSKKTDQLAEYNKKMNDSSATGWKAVFDTIGSGIKQMATPSIFSAIGDAMHYGEAADAELEATGTPSVALHTQGFHNLLRFVSNINDDASLAHYPFVTYYCNGPIERNMSFGLELGQSELAKIIVAGVKSNVRSTISKGASMVDNLLGNAASGIVEATGGNMEGAMAEWAHHNSGALGSSYLVNNLYVPKVQANGSSDFSWTIKLRSVGASDRFSILQTIYPFCTLIPYVVQPSMPRQAMIIPSSALYCSVFSKGVINAPRACITSMEVRTDNAFLTTFGVPTELDITLTVTPLFSVVTMPDFNTYWADQSANHSYLLGAMWNPMSTMNILATLCGQNTVLTKFPQGLFSFFVGGTMSNIKNTVTGSYASFRASLRDLTSSFELSANSSKMI